MITEETAMLYCVNKPKMRQRLDLARSGNQRVAAAAPSPMMVVDAAPPGSAHARVAQAESVVKPAPHPGVLKGMLNGFI